MKTIMTQNNKNDKRVSSSIINFFKKYKISDCLRLSNAYKSKGIPVVTLFQYLLTLGWSDGNTFLPVNSCLLSSENEKSRINESKKLDKRSVGFSRRKSSCTKATAVMLELIDSAIKACIPATHVLFDTWFCSSSSLIAIKKKNLDVVAMAKKTSKMHYLYNNEMQSLVDIYKKNRKRRGRSKYLLSVEISVVKDDAVIPANVVFPQPLPPMISIRSKSTHLTNIVFNNILSHIAG